MRKNIALLLVIALSSVVFAQKDKEKNEKHFDIFKSGDIYNAVWRELDINYVDTLDHDKLNNIAIASMLQSLDPYTVYIPENQEENLKTMTTGFYGGIGAVVQKNGDYVMIIEPRFGLPAQKNGLVAGDEIVEIDGENMKGKSTSAVSEKLKGVPGTEIRLKIRRNSESKLIEKKFLREAIHINSIEYYGVIADSVGYIQLNDFTDNSFMDFKSVLTNLSENNKINKLIIDLRDNGGGLVNEAVSISSLFLPKNTKIVSMKGKSQISERNYKTPFTPIMPDIQIVFLINEMSASASEILAGAFQDLDRAVVVGERSYGKGLVQSIRTLPYGGYLKVTTAKYYLPSGRCIQSVDYANSEDGRAKTVSDSLTNEFRTENGRTVRDKSGITPDVFVEQKEGNYISYYLYVKNIIFDFATKYCQKHKAIAEAKNFAITDADYQDFIAFVKDKQFSYQLESERMLQQLKKMVEMEGNEKHTAELFEQLTPILKPDLDRDLVNFRDDIQRYVEAEIVKRFYYQKGAIEHNLPHDEWVEKGLEVLQNPKTYNEVLKR
ncbi:MAG: S41 family peptidase [Prevotellaceae bacterium]|jgi:carboxyl-terminal processing protease|nr:S41 family peptidase [Prevotellaceae bacterium]